MNLCQIVGWFTGKRIKQVGDKFYAQYRECWYDEWLNVNRAANGRIHDEYRDICAVETADGARAILLLYVKNLEAEKDAAAIRNKVTIHCMR